MLYEGSIQWPGLVFVGNLKAQTNFSALLFCLITTAMMFQIS